MYRSGAFSQTHSVRKLTASWLIICHDRTPPSIGMKRTFGGVVVPMVRFDRRGLMVCLSGVIGSSMRRCFPLLMIWGVLPGMLFRVRRECVRAVFLNCRGAVGFGAVIIGGVSVIRVTKRSTLCSSMALSTLCSSEGAGGMYG